MVLIKYKYKFYLKNIFNDFLLIYFVNIFIVNTTSDKLQFYSSAQNGQKQKVIEIDSFKEPTIFLYNVCFVFIFCLWPIFCLFNLFN